MTSLLESRSLRTRPLVPSPPRSEQNVALCTALTTVDGIGLVACSLESDHADQFHREVDDSTGDVLTEWACTSRSSHQADHCFKQVA